MEYSFQDNQIQDRQQQQNTQSSRNEIPVAENIQQIDHISNSENNIISQVFEYGSFYSSQNQVIKKMHSLKLGSNFEVFTIAFSFMQETRENDEKQKKKKQEDFIHLIQIGNNNQKLIQISIDPNTQYLCVSYKRDVDYEYLFSQSKIRPSKIYHIQITYTSTMLDGQPCYHINMYINGVLQGQVDFSNPIKFVVKSLIFIGSESAENLFMGQISDFVISTQEFSIETIKEILDEKCSSYEELRNLPSILNILGELEVKNTIGLQNSLMTLQNKHQVPYQLQSSHGAYEGDMQMKKSLLLKNDEIMHQNHKKRKHYDDFRDSLLRNDDLNIAMRQMSLNYRWIFTTLFAMSPSVDDGIGQKVPFFCLHTLIANGNIQVNENYPIYVIESTRFHRVLSYSKVKISREQLEYLADKAGCIKTFTFEQELENNNKQKLKIEGIFYDQFMQMARDISLNEEEIQIVKNQAQINPHQEEEDIEREKREWLSVQNEFIKDNKKPMFVYNSLKHLQRVLKMKKVPEPFKECNLYKIVGFYLILPPFRSLSDVGYYNKFVQALFQYRYQNSITNLFKAICHGRLTRCEISLFHSFVVDKLQLESSPNIEEIFKMLCISNPTSFNEKEFDFFLNNWCIGSIYQHSKTGVQIYIDCFNQKYLEIDPQSKNLTDFFNQSALGFQNNANTNTYNQMNNNNNINGGNTIDSHQSLNSNSQPASIATSYFQFRVLIEEGESIHGLCGIEKDGYVNLESLKVITNQRKIQIAPLRNHRQFQNTFIYDQKVSSPKPQQKQQDKLAAHQLSPWGTSSQTTASPSFQPKSSQGNQSPLISSNQLSVFGDNPDDLDPNAFAIRKKSSTMITPKNQLQQQQQQQQQIEQNQNQQDQISQKRTSITSHSSSSPQNANGQIRNLTVAITSATNVMLDKKQESNAQNQQPLSISDRNIRVGGDNQKLEDNLFLYFDPQEMRKVTGFEILINQDHECPIKYQENQLMMDISSQKYLCRFSTLQLLSISQKSPKTSMDMNINFQTPTLSQANSFKAQPQSSANHHKHNSQNSNDFSLPHKGSQFNSNIHDHESNHVGSDFGSGTNTIQSPNNHSGRKYTNYQDYPIICNQWNQGKFQVIVNHCTNCENHQTTTWHEEADFCEKFNELGLLLQNLFPNVEIIGNFDKPKIIESFEVYIRGVGPIEMRDTQGRIILYRKNEPLKAFLTYFQQRMIKVFDGLILLSMSYADSSEMEKIQLEYLNKYQNLIPPIWNQYHEYPCIVPEKRQQLEEEKKRETEISIGTIMICKNWGCGQQYEYTDDNNSNKQCFYHPKAFDLGSMHGLWPESWSCCRGNWHSSGCTRGRHRGQPEKKFQKLCINHGAINPETKRPDSACGKFYSENDQKICRYHRGYFKMTSKDSGYWTCCLDGSYVAHGCHEDTHESATWPDPKAKIYFVERQLINPGLDRDKKMDTFEKSSLQSLIYRQTQAYKPYITKKTLMEIERKAMENETRICLNWGCEEKCMRFKEVDNIKDQERRIKNCYYHPGYFDFGNVNKPGGGILSIAQQLANPSQIYIPENAINPRWTCCKKPWKYPGCKLTLHRGPVEATMPELKYGRWPNVNAMKHFKKQFSAQFKQKMGELILTEDLARHNWYQFSIGKELIPMARIGELCDKFKLYWMALLEDLSYHFKYFDVLKGVAQTLLDNGNGFIERETFTKWWFTPLDQYPLNI
ncbi:concanavalin A-like lectin/glucanase family protein (macronuclear) [Tetrahymena thermophila SB210]|uniref:Concanavalin A-like lectin/glucanase family protein n=1 Tax=Tetrahymena thermophila (strain SB210) TaxID=312017 RepID=I7ME34_TETTS|nr:concanavalin A-like lectin/glucanase family protein [Tetrahymena thermophila SB210]EAR94166.2 concanavalin A-like lectin/glucanase family protein [Tetrahymena thermophila SB210]|eukprot:XP_001014411.2 concanavalin A-like lectin/glucanase family protein [Tetrahymena thermophila SB210]